MAELRKEIQFLSQANEMQERLNNIKHGLQKNPSSLQRAKAMRLCDHLKDSTPLLAEYIALSDLLCQAARGIDPKYPYPLPAGAKPFESPIDDVCQLSVRTSNCLKNRNLKTVLDVVKLSEGDLLTDVNFGRKSLNELKEELARIGHHLCG
ncbi:MAG: DNA-directed RNA polymerase subunit alpha C-terminal domain-containing protein [bacterium]|nr:DNA-directed RNA polymerase subunit alpha C-terminal domain-containing protein [bacterium]